MTSTSTILLVAVVWRIFIALSTRTFFQPDEFFQSLEVAHHLVFGYGHLTWEWAANPPIRSVAFPALYMPIYWILKVSEWDKGRALIIAPKIFQGIIAAIADVGTRELSRQLYGRHYADTAFVLSLSSFFHILALGRTLSNSVETSLTAAALCFWPWHFIDGLFRLQVAFTLAALSCLVRPTSIVLWSFLFVELLWRSRADKKAFKSLLKLSIITALVAGSCLLSIDSLYFGKLTFTSFNFVLTNLSSVSLFYGRAPWHYYLTQGLPILLNLCLPSFIFGAWSVWKSGLGLQKRLLGLIVWTFFVYSLLGHKEWRFLHPVLPLMLILAAKSLVDSDGRGKPVKGKRRHLNSRVVVICAFSILPGIYVMRYHGRAQISVMSYLRSLDPSVLRSVGFLMPCHSTPWQAYLHRPELSQGRLWALSCEPPLHGANITTYKDQTDIFYASPLTYLRQNFPLSVDPSFPPSPFPSTSPGSSPPPGDRWDHRWPSYLVFFGALIEEEREGSEVERYMRERGYVDMLHLGNGFEEDWRKKGGVRVWQWKVVKKRNTVNSRSKQIML